MVGNSMRLSPETVNQPLPQDLPAGRCRCTTINASAHALERPPARPRPASD
jgi:hypothetical protein